MSPAVREAFIYEIADLRRHRSVLRAAADDETLGYGRRAIAAAEVRQLNRAIRILRRLWLDILDIERRESAA